MAGDKESSSLQADQATTVAALKASVGAFCEARDWDQFHDLKELAIGLSTEAAELLQEFRFKSAHEVETLLRDAYRREAIEDEISDAFFFILRMAQKYGIDLSAALARKLDKNARKYPVETSRGSNKKYNE